MAFTDQQIRKLRAPVQKKHVKEREVEGRTFHYLEGWHVVAEANRIFGFHAWDRETMASTCVWQRPSDGRFSAAYLTRVRVSVRAGGSVIIREGLGSGEAVAPTVGQAHERASKAAETDATKRALSTFGNSFGLSLYRDKSDTKTPERKRTQPVAPRPVLSAAGSDEPQPSGRIEKSVLALPEPKRQRSREHLQFVASQRCLVCGKTPSQAHHLRIAQPRALGSKVSDEFTVPLCAPHHHELHMRGDERAWWHDQGIEPLKIAETLWKARLFGSAIDAAE